MPATSLSVPLMSIEAALLVQTEYNLYYTPFPGFGAGEKGLGVGLTGLTSGLTGLGGVNGVMLARFRFDIGLT